MKMQKRFQRDAFAVIFGIIIYRLQAGVARAGQGEDHGRSEINGIFEYRLILFRHGFYKISAARTADISECGIQIGRQLCLDA